MLLSWPVLCHAQYQEQDQQNPTQYRDAEDGQFLKLVSYILTPFGMALEWGVMRPLHYLATGTSAAPPLSGDAGLSFFGQNHNADQLPPGTFAHSPINTSNSMQLSNTSTSVAAPHMEKPTPQALSIPQSALPLSGHQPALQ